MTDAPFMLGNRVVTREEWEATCKHAGIYQAGVEQKGACPKCGCEEVNSRGLWTCECPA